MTTEANFPVTAGSIVVPYGHVIGNEKWRGSELAQRLQGKHKQTGRGKGSQAKHSLLLPSNAENGWNLLYSAWLSHICGTDYVSRLEGPVCLSCFYVISSVFVVAGHWREAAESAVVGLCGNASPLNSLEFTCILCSVLLAQQTQLWWSLQKSMWYFCSSPEFTEQL